MSTYPAFESRPGANHDDATMDRLFDDLYRGTAPDHTPRVLSALSVDAENGETLLELAARLDLDPGAVAEVLRWIGTWFRTNAHSLALPPFGVRGGARTGDPLTDYWHWVTPAQHDALLRAFVRWLDR